MFLRSVSALPSLRAALLVCTFLYTSLLSGQSIVRLTDEHTFDITSVKPADPDAKGMMCNFPASGLTANNVPVTELLFQAYGLVSVSEIEGLPSWAQTQRFDILAKPEPAYSEELSKLSSSDRWNRIAQMEQHLLQDRFALKAHIETRHRKVIRLVQSSAGSNTHLAISKEGFGRMTMMPAAFTAKGIQMNGLCNALSKLPELGQRVIDGTGLQEKYDFELHWLPPEQESHSAEAYPPLNQALQEQLGLKLERVMGDSEVLVVDSIHPPDAN